jgi:hypothetical protein
MPRSFGKTTALNDRNKGVQQLEVNVWERMNWAHDQRPPVQTLAPCAAARRTLAVPISWTIAHLCEFAFTRFSRIIKISRYITFELFVLHIHRYRRRLRH